MPSLSIDTLLVDLVGDWSSSVMSAESPVGRLDLGQHAGEDFEPQVLFVPDAVCPPLEHADLVVQTFHKTQRDFVLRFAVGGDPLPVALDHASELLIRRQPLPLQRGLPVLKELSRPALRLVVP